MRWRRRALPGAPVGGRASFLSEVRWGPVAWRGISTPAPWQQQGLWGEAILSQVVALYPGVQLDCVVGSLDPRWTVPGTTGIPTLSWLRMQAPVNLAGTQRNASRAPYGQGPIAVRQMKRAVAQASVAQSGAVSPTWLEQIRAWA